MWLRQSNEVASGNNEVFKTIKQISEENPHLDVEKYKKYLDIKLDEAQQNDLLNNKLSMSTILELSRIWRDVIKTELEWTANLEKNIRALKSATEKSDVESSVEWSKVDEMMNEFTNWIEKPTTVQGVKAVTGKASETVKEIWIWAKFKSAIDNAIEAFSTWGFFAAIGAFFSTLFASFKKEEIVDQVKEKMDSKEAKETKENLTKYITDYFWDSLTQENKSKLSSSLDKLTEKQIKELSEKLKKWDLTFYDITRIAPNIFKDFLKEEQIEIIKESATKKILESFKIEISKKYNIDLNTDKEKLDELEKLVRKNTKLSNDSIWTILSIQEKQEIKINDLFWPIFEWIINSSSIMLWLLTKWIVPVSAFWLEFADSSTKVIKLSANAMWVSSSLPIDAFSKSIELMNETEKAVLIWLLYRKWWLILNLTGSLLSTATRISTEFLTKTNVKTYDVISASLKNDYPKQIRNLNKISKSLWANSLKDLDWILYEAVQNLNKVTENYKILHILEKAKWDTVKAVDLLKKAWINTIPSKNLPFDKFVNTFKNNASPKITEFLSKWSAASAIWFWSNADLFKLNKTIESITIAQRKMFEWNFLTKWIGKLRELLNVWEISRLWDRVTLHFESVEAAKKGISKWNILANKFPDLVKWSLDKLPIIAVAWISLNSDKPFFEEFQKELKYLIPLVWPVLLVSDSWFSWKDWKLESINWIEAWIWWALIGLDTVFLTKEFIKWWVRWAGWYMIKPLADLYSIWRWTAEWAYSVWKALVNWKSFSQLAIKWAKEAKELNKLPSKLKAIAALWIIWYLWINYILEDDVLKEITDDKWNINKDKLDKKIDSFSSDEKLLCIKAIINENYDENIMSDIDIKLKDNKLSIISYNPKVKSDWFIDNKITEMFRVNNEIDFIYKEKAA